MSDTDIQSNPDTAFDPEAAALSSLAKDDDASRYIEQRIEQENGPSEGPDESEPDTSSNLIEQELERARQRTREAREQSDQLDAEYNQAEREWLAQQQVEQQERNRRAAELSYYEARGRCMEQGRRLLQTNPELHKRITDNLTALEPILSDQQSEALQMALVYYPEAVWAIGFNLSYESNGQSMYEKMEIVRNETPEAIIKGAQQAAQQHALERLIQTRIYQDRVQNGRRITQAPPVMSTPRGHANAPRDIHRVATKDDASDYVKMRRAQMARDSRD
jgi:hypothetical protein